MNRRHRFEHLRLVVWTTVLGSIPAGFVILVAAFESVAPR